MNALSTISPAAAGFARLKGFVADLRTLVTEERTESAILARGGRLLADLVRHDDWLPDSHAVPGEDNYRQYLLHADPLGGFSVVSFVWGPGQATPIHNHRVWGLVGVLRGGELAQRFGYDDDGALRSAGPAHRLDVGDVDAVSPRIGDIHRVANAYDDRVSISIHVYGADIGRVERSTYGSSGLPKPFVSGYADVPAVIA